MKKLIATINFTIKTWSLFSQVIIFVINVVRRFTMQNHLLRTHEPVKDHAISFLRLSKLEKRSPHYLCLYSLQLNDDKSNKIIPYSQMAN